MYLRGQLREELLDNLKGLLFEPEYECINNTINNFIRQLECDLALVVCQLNIEETGDLHNIPDAKVNLENIIGGLC